MVDFALYERFGSVSSIHAEEWFCQNESRRAERPARGPQVDLPKKKRRTQFERATGAGADKSRRTWKKGTP
jgi:hypothetical protein